MIDEILKDAKKDKTIIAAYLFGSHGTKRETPLSDIDICFFTKDIAKKTILNAFSFGGQKIDISVFDLLPPHVKVEVFKGKPLFVKNKYFVAEKFAKSFREHQDFRKYRESYLKAVKRRLA